MEQGSLLQEALAATASHPGATPACLANTLVVDVYQTTGRGVAAAALWLTLAHVAVVWNQHVREANHPWFHGCVPVFGVTCDDENDDEDTQTQQQKKKTRKVPHLRAVCRYGISVADEWKFIQLVLECTKQPSFSKMAVECWDVDDGQVLLIQASDALPSWVDEIGPDECRHRCWIRNGSVCMLPPDRCPGNTIRDALRALSCNNDSLIDWTVTKAIQSTVAELNFASHRAAVALPRAVAQLFARRKDWLAVAARVCMEQHYEDNQRRQHSDTAKGDGRSMKQKQWLPWNEASLDGLCHDDWVWTVLPFGRPTYAMLQSHAAHTSTESFYSFAESSSSSSLELKRIARVCAVEATPHLRHGLDLGVRLVSGLDCLLGAKPSSPSKAEPSLSDDDSTIPEHRIAQWAQIIVQATKTNNGWSDDDDDDDSTGASWLWEAWRAGPNEAKHCLDDVLQCPTLHDTYQEEARLPQQLRHELRRTRTTTSDDQESLLLFAHVPGPSDVDTDEWMHVADGDADLRAAAAGKHHADYKHSNNPLNAMMNGVQSFMHTQSSIDGVSTTNPVVTDNDSNTVRGGTAVTIDPATFLHVLRTTLQSTSIDDLSQRLDILNTRIDQSNDPFFAQEDYDLMDPDDEEDDSENGEDTEEQNNIQDVMDAMDSELQEAASRKMDDGHDIENSEEVREDVHVLTNLLKSLDAGGGGSGAMKNMLGEMGIQSPDGPEI